jgi:hypothetical protein
MGKITAQDVVSEIEQTKNKNFRKEALSLLQAAAEDGYEDVVALSSTEASVPAKKALRIGNEIALVRGDIATQGNVITADGVENNFVVILGDLSCANLEIGPASTIFVLGNVNVGELLMEYEDATLFYFGTCKAKYFMRDDAIYEVLRDAKTVHPESFPNQALWETCESIEVGEVFRDELVEHEGEDGEAEVDLKKLQRALRNGESPLKAP